MTSVRRRVIDDERNCYLANRVSEKGRGLQGDGGVGL